MKKNTNFQIVKNTLLGNPNFGRKAEKNQLVITFRLEEGLLYLLLTKGVLNNMVRDILKCPVLSKVSLSKPLTEQAVDRLVNCFGNNVIMGCGIVWNGDWENCSDETIMNERS